MKRFCLFVVLCVLCGCDDRATDSTDADAVQRKATKQAMGEAQRQVGMPAIKNFQERKLAKMIFELRDQEDYVCHAYLANPMTGQVGRQTQTEVTSVVPSDVVRGGLNLEKIMQQRQRTLHEREKRKDQRAREELARIRRPDELTRLNAENAGLRLALADCMTYVECDNLTTQTKHRNWQAVLDGKGWNAANCEVDDA